MHKLTVLAIACCGLALAACQGTQNGSYIGSQVGVANGMPCGWRAVDAGICPYYGYRKPQA